MSVRNSLLAILSVGPCYGFQLKVEFERRTGSAWPVNVGQVYTTLTRLVRDGLAARGAADAEGRELFEITDAGRGALTDWFSSPVTGSGARDEFAMKCVMALSLPGRDIESLLAVQEAWIDARRRELAAAMAEASPARRLALSAAIHDLDAQSAWIARVRESADEIAPSGNATTLPKRGRPAKKAVTA
ncbi:PadR family transcriptional regulator [Gryllotalpicola ginsengisoli]|uniref:PadR family transcriptional regulator n=1 Tax=Gryllotalpicola ginsengisoli TaxID=444608 RepID=UPI0003B7BA8B|nr:PadR family transcriptional regulator [Gryllotalpicola ginsengisoli]